MKKFTFAIAFLLCAFASRAQVTTLYGNGNPGYYTDGFPASGAEFTNPYGIAYDTKGNLWITDQGNNFIILIDNAHYYIREGQQAGGFQDGASSSLNGGLVNFPAGMIVVPGLTSASDQIYLCDAGNSSIRKIDSLVSLTHSQYLSTVAGGGTKVKGMPGVSGHTNGAGTIALFNNPTGIGYVKDASGGYLVIADKGNNAIRKVSLHKSDYGTTSDIAASGLFSPEGIFVDSKNNNTVYVAQSSAGSGISTVSPTGIITNIVPGKYLQGPTSLVVSGTDMYIADGCHIAYFDMTKSASFTNPSVMAGNIADTICDYKDGTDSMALFSGIASMVLSADGKSLIVADAGNNSIRRVIIGHTSGIENTNSKMDQFSVYPNPAVGHVLVKSQNSRSAIISLYNITGQQVINNKVDLSAGSPYDMSLENQPLGVYILQVTTENGIYSQKVVVR